MLAFKIFNNCQIFNDRHYGIPDLEGKSVSDMFDTLGKKDYTVSMCVLSNIDYNGPIPDNLNIMISYNALDSIKIFKNCKNVQISRIHASELDKTYKHIKIQTLVIDVPIDLSGWKVVKIDVRSDYNIGTNNDVMDVIAMDKKYCHCITQHRKIDALWIKPKFLRYFPKININQLLISTSKLDNDFIKLALANENIKYFGLNALSVGNVTFDLSKNTTLETIRFKDAKFVLR